MDKSTSLEHKKLRIFASAMTKIGANFACLVVLRGDHGAGVPEWTPEGVYDFCRSRNMTRRRILEWKPDPELEQEW